MNRRSMLLGACALAAAPAAVGWPIAGRNKPIQYGLVANMPDYPVAKLSDLRAIRRRMALTRSSGKLVYQRIDKAAVITAA